MKKREIKTIVAYPFPKVEVTLYHSKRKLKRDLESRGVDVELKDAPGQMFTREIDGDLIDFVLIDMKQCRSLELWEQFGLLAHEAQHITNGYFERIGEDAVGEEESAYIMQAVSGCLFDFHIEYLKRNRKAKPWKTC